MKNLVGVKLIQRFVFAFTMCLLLFSVVSAKLDFNTPEDITSDLATKHDQEFGIAMFLNVHQHKAGIERLGQLKPQLVRFFVTHVNNQPQLDRIESAIKTTEIWSPRILLQFNLDPELDHLSLLKEYREVIRQFANRVDYWQFGNEIDNDIGRYFPRNDKDADDFGKFLSELRAIIQEEDPGSHLAISFSTRVYEQKRRTRQLKTLVTSLLHHIPDQPIVIDAHWHREARQAFEITDHIARLKEDLAQLKIDHFIMTENNTHTLDAVLRNRSGNIVKRYPVQTEMDQAAYGVETVYRAFAAGVRSATFGYAVERDTFGRLTRYSDHLFALNGLWYSETKEYNDGIHRSGPKRSAFTYWLLSRLLREAPPTNIELIAESVEHSLAIVSTIEGDYLVRWSIGDNLTSPLEFENHSFFDHSAIKLTVTPESPMIWPPIGLADFKTSLKKESSSMARLPGQGRSPSVEIFLSDRLAKFLNLDKIKAD